MLFTNDGALANALTHPSHQVAKMYRVTVHPAATEEQVVALANGVVLDDGTKTLPAIIRVVAEDEDRTVMEMSIKEGKNDKFAVCAGQWVLMLQGSAERV